MRVVRQISPSTLGVFFALEQCHRFLHLALLPQPARDNMLTAAGVRAEKIPPVLTKGGNEFEKRIYEALQAAHPATYCHGGSMSGHMAAGNGSGPASWFLRKLKRLQSAETAYLAQFSVENPFDDWKIDGKPDLVVASADETGRLRLLICDVKASREPRLEHRLQVALYARMLQKHLPDASIEQGVIYRLPVTQPTTEADRKRLDADRTVAGERLGIDCALLSIADAPSEFDVMLDRVLFGDESIAQEVSEQDFAVLPFHIERKCDVCAFNELCLRHCRESEDLSLIPYLGEQDKRALIAHEVTSVRQLAELQQLNPEKLAELRHVWPVGHRMGELTERAAAYLKWQREDVDVSDRLTDRGYSTLPPVSPTQHPNLIQIFLDAQSYDVEDRVYMLGAIVRGHEDGKTSASRTRIVIELAEKAPEEDAEEAELLKRWINRLLIAVREVAAPTKTDRGLDAPIHIYVYERESQRRLLATVERHANNVLSVEALFHLLMQRAAFDTGNVSVLSTEIERQWNLPMLCQSLQAVAAFRGFDWSSERELKRIFRHRLFDQLGVETKDDQPLFSPRRSRFKSDIPIEYPYLAWEGTGAAEFSQYGEPTLEDLRAFEQRRLEAMIYLTEKLWPNHQTTKTDFDLTKVMQGSSIRPETVLAAMKNFVVVERHSVLNGWRAMRHVRPEIRVLQGETLIGRYRESDQDVGIRQELRQSVKEYETKVEAWRKGQESGEEGHEPSWKAPEVSIRLELTPDDLGSDPALARRRTNLKPGSSIVIAPRWNVDTRPGADQTVKYASTAKQIMLGARGEAGDIYQRDGRWWVDVELGSGTYGNKPGFTFSSFLSRPLIDDELYTLDPDPTSWPEANRLNVIEEVEPGPDGAGQYPHPFGAWLGREESIAPEWPVEAEVAQRRFFDGLVELGGYIFEADKQRYIGGLNDEPVLLVQGPPGTGKSFTAAYAILARIQGALAADLPFRVAISCVTHSATDVLLSKIAGELANLRGLRGKHPDRFDEYFDPRLFDLSLYRYIATRDMETKTPPLGCQAFQHKEGPARVNSMMRAEHVVVAGTPGQIRKLGREGLKGKHGAIWDLVVVDEASQMTAPDALQATFGLKETGRVVFVGDHRQMAPVVHHAWDDETEARFDPYAMHRSIFDLIRLERATEWVKFPRSFRLHRDVAEFLRREVYEQDQIAFYSDNHETLVSSVVGSPLVEAALNGGQAMVVIVHDEMSSQQRNLLERDLVLELFKGIKGREAALTAEPATFGVVVPHRAQRADVRDELVAHFGDDSMGDHVDTVERFQGGERDIIIVSATESDPAYLRATGDFLFDPRRLNVALSRAKKKLIVLASKSVFHHLPGDEQQLRNTAIWRNLLADACTDELWAGAVGGHWVRVMANKPLLPTETSIEVAVHVGEPVVVG